MPRQVRLSEAIEEFVASRAGQGYAKHTVKTSSTALNRLLDVVGNIYLESLNPRHIDSYFAAHANRWSPGTKNLMRAHLSMFFQWCRQRQYMTRDNDPLVGTRRLRQPRRDYVRVPVTGFPALLDCAHYPRNRMVVATGLYLFLRASEITTLQVKHVHLDRNEVTVTVHKAAGDVDNMPISTPLRHELHRWLTYYEHECGPLDPDWYLVPAVKAAPGYYDHEAKRIQGVPGGDRFLNPTRPIHQPHEVVKRVLGIAGYATFREGCHTLRRSGARALFDELAEAGHDRALEIVSSMLHHQEMGTTQTYLGLAGGRAKRDELLKGRQMFAVNEAAVMPLRAVSGD